MSKGLVVILMGSKADLEHSQKIKASCVEFNLDAVLRIGSAHKTPEYVIKLLKEYESDSRPKVYITVAGRSNALSGFIDGLVVDPVIACPPPGEIFGVVDLFSSLRMPSGIAPALVLEPLNAALLAAKILALTDPDLRASISKYHSKAAEKIIQDDQALV